MDSDKQKPGSNKDKIKEVVRTSALKPTPAAINRTVSQIKRQAQAERIAFVRAELEVNRVFLQEVTKQHETVFSSFKQGHPSASTPGTLGGAVEPPPSSDAKSPALTNGEEGGELIAFRGEAPFKTVEPPQGGNPRVLAKPVRMPAVHNVPKYMTWIHISRNQRMTEDQSVLGRRRLYYDANKDETTVCSDTDEDDSAPDEQRNFKPLEDRIITRTLDEHGSSNEVIAELASILKVLPREIIERHAELTRHQQGEGPGNKQQQRALIRLASGKRSAEAGGEDLTAPRIEDTLLISWDKATAGASVRPESLPAGSTLFESEDLETAMDSWDNLFCRRCLVFDCKLHGTGQEVILPFEKQKPVAVLHEPDQAVPCGPHCFRMPKMEQAPKEQLHLELAANPKPGEETGPSKQGRPIGRKRKAQVTERRPGPCQVVPPSSPTSQTFKKMRRGGPSRKRDGEDYIDLVSEDEPPTLINKPKQYSRRRPPGSAGLKAADEQAPASTPPREWTAYEQDLCAQGRQMFGHNSCLIASVLLKGHRNCQEVADHLAEEVKASGSNEADENGVPGESKRRRGRFRGGRRRTRFVCHAALRRRKDKNGNEQGQGARQYTPCSCQGPCGSSEAGTCPCLLNGTLCEKFCGCARVCKNRYPGCQCAKSQCGTKACPCVAASRECDPDLCRHCPILCGDGTIPPPPGNEGKCQNMKMLLAKHQHILLGRSQVTGWGAFLKEDVGREAFLGEYTGELISHKEADRRGKIYDRVNSSFLFDLNDQFVLDALRKGNKLKFANHSSNPNCEAKVMLVAGDHRVAIYSKKKISAGQELFYDYRYAPERAPDWALSKRSQDAGGSRTYIHSSNHKNA